MVVGLVGLVGLGSPVGFFATNCGFGGPSGFRGSNESGGPRGFSGSVRPFESCGSCGSDWLIDSAWLGRSGVPLPTLAVSGHLLAIRKVQKYF